MIDPPGGRGVRGLAVGLSILSLLALIVTAWGLSNVIGEQEIVRELMKNLPADEIDAATELSGDLSVQSGLLILLVLNVIATGVALRAVVRAYFFSEQSLRDAKVLSSDILASMDAGVITTDLQGTLTSVNLCGHELLRAGPSQVGPADESLIGRNIAEIGDEHSLLAEICDENRLRARPIRDRDYCVVRGGQTRTLRAGCTRLHDRAGQQIGMVIHVRDVTQRALIEQRLRRMERYMGLGSLAAGLQHEIKNPLSALALHIQLLAERLARQGDDPEINESLDVLHTEIKRIGDVLDGFRNYASLGEIGRSPVDVGLLIEKLVRLLRPHAEKRAVRLRFESASQPLGLIDADSVRLEQVFLNLALNGIAAMPEGGLLQFTISEQSKWMRIEVSDSGSGIDEEIQAKIFDPYFTTRSEGTGMGLALCDKIIRQHNGNLDFKTNASGTTFTVLLPRSASA